jgi:hypothetical protein
MQPLFAEAPDAARRECHQFVVWRVISDFPPPFKDGGTDIVARGLKLGSRASSVSR